MARGSENKLGDYPNTCEVCGENVRFSSTTLPLWFACDSATGELHTFHMLCHPAYPRDSVVWREAA